MVWRSGMGHGGRWPTTIPPVCSRVGSSGVVLPHRLLVPYTDEPAVGVCQPGAVSPVVALRCIPKSDTPSGHLLVGGLYMLHLEVQSAPGGRAAILAQDECEVALILQPGDMASIELNIEAKHRCVPILGGYQVPYSKGEMIEFGHRAPPEMKFSGIKEECSPVLPLERVGLDQVRGICR